MPSVLSSFTRQAEQFGLTVFNPVFQEFTVSNLMLHTGGKVATLDEVRNTPTPSAVGRWHPTSHATVLDSVRETLT